jgi:hypothetical protein
MIHCFQADNIRILHEDLLDCSLHKRIHQRTLVCLFDSLPLELLLAERSVTVFGISEVAVYKTFIAMTRVQTSPGILFFVTSFECHHDVPFLVPQRAGFLLPPLIIRTIRITLSKTGQSQRMERAKRRCIPV